MTAAPESFAVTTAYAAMRLDRFLQRMLPRMSRTTIQDAIATRVKLTSGAAPKPARRLAVGEVVQIWPRTAAAEAEGAAVPAIAELAAGPGWVVVDKPAGVATTPSARRPGEDLTSRLGMAPAHRLDRFTSGCLLLTRDADTARRFARAFRDRGVTKHYLAIVTGAPRADQLLIDAPIGPASHSRVPGRMAVTAAGAAARTEVTVLRRSAGCALVRATPLTGRRHQLRVHLAHAGHPIVGDLIYGGDERQFVRWQLGQPIEVPAGLSPGRHLLHAHHLAFVDPLTERAIEVDAPLPDDFTLDGAPFAQPEP